MPVEIEAKLKIDSLDTARQRLAAVGAHKCGAALERNYIFDKKDRSLLTADMGLRIRAFDALEGQTKQPELTYKGRRLEGPLKAREEIETAIGDADATRSILKALGFIQVLYFEKRRESWTLDSCHIELDELPYLGTFLEIEGPDAAAVTRVQARLGLADGKSIRVSYVALLIEYCHEHGLPTNRVVFEPSPT